MAGFTVPFEWLIPVGVTGGESLSFWSPLGPFVSVVEGFGVAVGAAWGDFGAADPRVECVVGPFDF